MQVIPAPLVSPSASSACNTNTPRFRALVILISLFFASVLLARQVITPTLVASALRDAATQNGITALSYVADLVHSYNQTNIDNSNSSSSNNNNNNNNNDKTIITTYTISTNTNKNETDGVDGDDEDDEIASGGNEEDNEEENNTTTSTKYMNDSSSPSSIQSSEEDSSSFDSKALPPPPPTTTTTKSLKGTSWHIPPTMSMHTPVTPNTTESELAISHVWTQPRVISAYTRRLHDDSTQLFIYATGVTMGNFNQRNLSIFGCLLGRDVYPLKYHQMDVFLCSLPSTRKISPDGELASVVIRDDKALDRAISAPVHLKNGVHVNLTRDVDVLSLPDGVSLPDSLSPGQLVMTPSSVLAKDDAKSEAAAYNRDVVRIGGEQREDEKIPRYEICGVTMMKQFPNLLPDWIAYHRRIGVDMLYLLDNDATVDINATFADRPDVDVIYWPFQRSQVQAMSMFVVAARHRCEWLIGFDADEYILLGIGAKHERAHKKVLKLFLNDMRRAGFDDVRFKYVTMGPSGNVRIPSTPVPEAYIAKWTSQKLNTKSASLTSKDWLVSKIHFQKGPFWPKTRHTRKVNDKPVTLDDGPALVHFQFRSLEEAMLKKKFGSSSIGDQNLDDGSSKETRTLKNPGTGYTQIPEHLRYEYFRDVWRRIMDDDSPLTQTLVKWSDKGYRCTVSVSQDLQNMSEELCVREQRKQK